MPTVADRPLSVKLRPWLEDELRQEFEARGESTSEGLRRVLEEWWALRRFPHLEFREGLGGRRAALEGGPEIWEIVAARREYGPDPASLREHFGWLPEAALQEALSFYERFPERIDARLEDNDRAGRYLAGRLGQA